MALATGATSPYVINTCTVNYSKKVSGLDTTYKCDSSCALYSFGAANKSRYSIGFDLYAKGGFWYNSDTKGDADKHIYVVINTDGTMQTVSSLSGFTYVGKVSHANGYTVSTRARGEAYANIYIKK